MGLNAAIELEVVRRLKERVQAAAMSRQTFALVNQQLPLAAVSSQTTPSLAFGLNGATLQAQLLQQQQLGLSANMMMNKGLKNNIGLGDFLSPMEGMGLE